MFGKRKTQEMVALLVDHLDNAISLAERLSEATFTPLPLTPQMSADDILAEHGRLRDFLDELRTLEVALIARVEKARSWAREVRQHKGSLKLMASLFLTGTQALADAMAELADPATNDFNGGDQVVYFLKIRGLAADHIATLDEIAQIGGTESFRLIGRMPLEALLDLCSSFIDALDIQYRLGERSKIAPLPSDAPAIQPLSATAAR